MSEFNDQPNPDQPVYDNRNKKGKIRKDIFPGLFVLAVGLIFLLKQAGVLFPYWLFTWPVILIAVGLFISIRHRFRGGAGVFPILIGLVFLINEISPELKIAHFIWPSIIIGIGLLLIIRPNKHRWRKWYQDWEPHQQRRNIEGTAATLGDANDYIDSTSIFSGIKKIVLSKNFKGGDVTNFMGGTEINLTQADINGKITIDVTNIFGGAKLIIPSSWDVQSDVVAIFGGVDDKRQLAGTIVDPNKIIHLDGTCLFGGIEIRSF